MATPGCFAAGEVPEEKQAPAWGARAMSQVSEALPTRVKYLGLCVPVCAGGSKDPTSTGSCSNEVVFFASTVTRAAVSRLPRKHVRTHRDIPGTGLAV